jgi:hypothetical protein
MACHWFKSIAASGVFVGWISIGPVAVAQHATPPSVTVVTFEGSAAPREARDAMADELAARLVDTGHFRVLHREWLPHESTDVPALDVLRAAAGSVGVDYLVLGSIRQSTSAPAAHVSVMTSGAFGPAFGRPVMALPRPRAMQPAREQTTVVVNVRVVDVTSADIVRTATVQRTYTSSASSSAPFLSPVAGRPAALVAALATMAARPKPASTRLTKDWRHVVQDVARQLDGRGLPPRNAR